MQQICLMAIGSTQPVHQISELRLSHQMFMFRADAGLKLKYLDARLSLIQ
jgi:hypothetical protein